MKNKLNEMIKNAKEDICMFVKDMQTNEILFEYQKDKQVVSASTIKVPIMLTALEEVRLGHMSLDEELLVSKETILDDTNVFEYGECRHSLYEIMMWMIINSDNTATNVLINKLTMDKINEYSTRVLETKNTKVERIMLDFDAIEKGYNNYISQQDLCTMFTKLHYKEILNEELCKVAMKILCNQRWNDQIPRYIYEPTLFAHKTGGLDYLHHDAGIMLINNKWYFIGISIKSDDNINGNYPLMGKLGKTVYDELISIKC